MQNAEVSVTIYYTIVETGPWPKILDICSHKYDSYYKSRLSESVDFIMACDVPIFQQLLFEISNKCELYNWKTPPQYICLWLSARLQYCTKPSICLTARRDIRLTCKDHCYSYSHSLQGPPVLTHWGRDKWTPIPWHFHMHFLGWNT